MYKIFIVEDDAIIANQIKKRLEMWDYEVTLADNFRDITSDFARIEPSLILMDITLPFYNGYHWCNEIRKLSSAYHIHLIGFRQYEYCYGDEYGR